MRLEIRVDRTFDVTPVVRRSRPGSRPGIEKDDLRTSPGDQFGADESAREQRMVLLGRRAWLTRRRLLAGGDELMGREKAHSALLDDGPFDS